MYVEPFAGSLACLLARPTGGGAREIVCDLDGGIANFWRAVEADPDAVAYWADHPSIHHDLTARHKWLKAWFGKLAPDVGRPALLLCEGGWLVGVGHQSLDRGRLVYARYWQLAMRFHTQTPGLVVTVYQRKKSKPPAARIRFTTNARRCKTARAGRAYRRKVPERNTCQTKFRKLGTKTPASAGVSAQRDTTPGGANEIHVTDKRPGGARHTHVGGTGVSAQRKLNAGRCEPKSSVTDQIPHSKWPGGGQGVSAATPRRFTPRRQGGSTTRRISISMVQQAFAYGNV